MRRCDPSFRMRRATGCHPLSLAFSVMLAAGGAHAEPRTSDRSLDECLSAADRGQSLRFERKLSEARAVLLTCARHECPGALRNDCARWVDELDRDLASLVVRAVDENGKDLAVRGVAIDGTSSTDAASGWAVLVDPGRHVVRAVAEGGRTAEQTVVVGQGEKNRAVLLRMPSPAVAPIQASPASASTVPPVVYAAGAVGVVALATFAWAGLTGASDMRSLRQECGARRLCTEADVDPVRTKMLVGDVIGAVGVAAVGVAVYFLVDHLQRGPRAGHVDARGSILF
jgi:hypothetical protein